MLLPSHHLILCELKMGQFEFLVGKCFSYVHAWDKNTHFLACASLRLPKIITNCLILNNAILWRGKSDEVRKNRSDGNKRIAAFLFLWFLEKNRILYRNDGTKLIENNTLVALTLMIAESRPEEKDMITKVVVNLINRNN